MQALLLNFPLWLLFVVMVLGSGVVAGLGSWLVSRVVPQSLHRGNNEVGAPIFSIVGLIFSIILGFMIPAVYSDFEAAASSVSQESNEMEVLYRLTLEAPEPTRTDIQAGLVKYAQLVVSKEWDLMARSQSSPDVDAALDRLWQMQRNFQPANNIELALRNQMFEQVHRITDRRHNRLLDSRTQLEPIMWFMLISGGFITIAFSLFIRAANDRNQAIMVGIMASMIGFGLLIVMVLDSPFTGSVRVPPDIINNTLDVFRRLKGG